MNDEVLQRTRHFTVPSHRCTSVFGHVARLDDDTPANMALQLHIITTDLLTALGLTSYETIPPVRLETSGGVLSTVEMVVQRRDGPRRLRDHDDDDEVQRIDDFVYSQLDWVFKLSYHKNHCRF